MKRGERKEEKSGRGKGNTDRGTEVEIAEGLFQPSSTLFIHPKYFSASLSTIALLLQLIPEPSCSLLFRGVNEGNTVLRETELKRDRAQSRPSEAGNQAA